MLSPGTIIQNRYRIIKLIMAGGMGAVYKGYDTRLDITVALKELFDNSPDASVQFEKEAKILARLKHQNLPRVIDYFNEKNTNYLVMDFIEGQDLQEILESQPNPISEINVLEWIQQVLDALDYVHQNQIIHRDIKPSNIKLNSQGTIILVDFGIAKVGASLKTATGAKGAYTPHFSPPEQYSLTAKTDVTSDIYMVGTTMYYLLTKQLPLEAIDRTMNGDVLNPKVINNTISDYTANVVIKSTNLQSKDRYLSAIEMKRDLLLAVSHINSSVDGLQCGGSDGWKFNSQPSYIEGKQITTGFVRDIRKR